MSVQCDDAIITQMIHYLETVLEKPHPVFGGLPICPFSKKARLQNKILYKVLNLSFAELQPNSVLLKAIQEFQTSECYDVLLFICPNVDFLSVDQVRSLVKTLNEMIASMKLAAFGGHPLDTFNIQGIYTRREPFINITIQGIELLNAASQQLKKTNYYHNWSPENLQEIGFEQRG
jgi:hypothetical protein